MTTAATIAEALATALTTAGYTATRVYQLTQEITDLDEFVHSVAPRGSRREMVARGVDLETYVVAIVVQKRVDPATIAEIDAVLARAEAIKALFGTGGSLRHQKMDGASYTGTMETDPLLIPEHLAQYLTATTYLTLEYSLER